MQRYIQGLVKQLWWSFSENNLSLTIFANTSTTDVSLGPDMKYVFNMNTILSLVC